jgi:protein-L-isoaspartate(D-aspartate) O-methyltransferase
LSTEASSPKKSNSSRVATVAAASVLVLGVALLAIYFLGVGRPAANRVEDPPGTPAATAAAAAEPSSAPPDAPVYDIRQRAAEPPTDSYEAYLGWMLKNTDETEAFLKAKWQRAQSLLTWSKYPDITQKRVLAAFLLTPREYFCRSYNRDRAYANAAMPIGYGQTISGPHMVSRMTNAINPGPEDKVLEIGTGSGYQSAVLSELTNRVYTIEIVEPLAGETDQIYKDLSAHYPEYQNIKRKVDDGYYGWPEYAPFDRIIVTAGIDHIPPPLLQQLAPNGIMVIPIGPPAGQKLLKITKNVAPDGTVTLEREDIFAGTGSDSHIFVPFTKKGGGTHMQGQ